MNDASADKLTDIVILILRTVQADLSGLKSGQQRLEKKVDNLDDRLRAVEGHMMAFMSSARRLDIEMDELRG